MKRCSKKTLFLCISYILFIYLSLYFIPFIVSFFDKHSLLKIMVNSLCMTVGITSVLLWFYKYKILKAQAYLFLVLIFLIFIFEFLSTPLLVERIHYLEYAFLYALLFRVTRHFFKGPFLYGITLWTGMVLSLLDEGIQHILPNRYFDSSDIYRNTIGLLLGLAAVLILMHYRRDKLVRNP